jgi:hypothetical protein
LALDPSSERVTTRATATSSGALGLLGPPAARAGSIAMLALTPSRTIALVLDGAGAETMHQPVGPTLVTALPDGGTGLASVPPHVGTLLDPEGDLAFALPTGALGVVAAAGAVEVVGDVCARPGGPPASGVAFAPRGSSLYAGLAPAAPFAIVATCGNGVVARIDSDFAPAP